MPNGEIQIIQGLQLLFQGAAGHAIVGFCARWMIFAFAPLAALTSWRKNSRTLRHAAYEAAWSALLALVIAMMLGVMIGRVRPFNASSSVERIIPPPASTYSLPSGHASVAFAIAFALAFGNPSLGVVAFAIAGLVAFGRVAAGVHYPTDVLAGTFVGFTAFLLVRYLHQALRRRDVRGKRGTQSPPTDISLP
jgi:undecaprenyl-diphosphatase